MRLKNTSALLGSQLEYVNSVDIQIIDGMYNLDSSFSSDSIDCQGLILIPGLINCHTHIGDSIAKDAVLQGSVDQKIHPALGAKHDILENSTPQHLVSFMQNTCSTMLKRGITTFVDFRENGISGLELLAQATSKIPIRCISLGRVDNYNNPQDIKNNTPLSDKQKSELSQVVQHSDGIGISGTNEHTDSVLQSISETSKLRAIHAAETIQSAKQSLELTGKTETQRAMILKPDFLVHMTHATDDDLRLAAKTNGIIVCPRANATLAEGIPDVKKMLKLGCNVTLGTDNIMINSPDMFREMDYLWKVVMGINKQNIDPKIILKMSTTNAAKLVGRNIGYIQNRMMADGIFIEKHSIDLEPMLNPFASIVHRVSESTIRAVMVGGKIVYGKI